MQQIIKKELIISFALFLIGGLVQHYINPGMAVSWTIFSIILFALFASSTLLFNWLIKRESKNLGVVFAAVTFVSQAILIGLLFLLLEPNEPNDRTFAILALINYLLFLLIDTIWKLKWFFKTN